ncbi:major facilitator superfamily domain-containing protein [Aspergillus recurvatus]
MATKSAVVEQTSVPVSPVPEAPQCTKPVSFRHRLKRVLWDTFDYSREERRLLFKIDFFILHNMGELLVASNWSEANAYVSGMKEELHVVGNQYQTFTTMWTMYAHRVKQPEIEHHSDRNIQWLRDLPDPVADDLHPRYAVLSHLLSLFSNQQWIHLVRLSFWCPSWECLWVIVTFASAAVKTPYQLYACRLLVGLAEGTFYPAVHTVLGGWYTKRELAKRACIFFGSAFVGSMFSGYLQAALYTGMNGVHGLSGWRWLFIFDGVITFPMAIWGYLALPDLPSNTRVIWLRAEEKELALSRMRRAGKSLEEPITWKGTKRVLSKWHFWVYTAYYTFFICSENIGSYMNLWLKSLNRYSVSQINTYPTVTNAITILTSLLYGWASDLFQIRYPIVFFSLTVCFFAAMNLAVWDGVPFGLKWASYYLTGFAQGSGPVFLVRSFTQAWRSKCAETLIKEQTMVNEICAGDSLERKIILGSTNSIAYAFNAWIPLVSYNTNYAPRFLVGNSVTVGLIVCAAGTLGLAVYLQRRDERRQQSRVGSGGSGDRASVSTEV